MPKFYNDQQQRFLLNGEQARKCEWGRWITINSEEGAACSTRVVVMLWRLLLVVAVVAHISAGEDL